MNLNRRVEKLENKAMPGYGVTVINLEKNETEDQAKQRYCSTNDISVGKLEAQSKLTIFLRSDFGD